MKPRRNAATTGPRNSTLQTVRTLPDISECSSDNLLEQLKYFAENPVDNLDMIVSISSRLYLKITSQDKTSKDKVLDKIRRGKREFYPLFLKLIEIAPNLRSMANVIGLLCESLSSKNVVHKNLGFKLMTELDATSVLARTLIHHDISYLSEHLTQLVWILGQMSWRDSRFLVKMRKFHSGVRVFHKLLKLRQVHHSPIFVSTLYCLKTLTKSPLLGNILVRDGIAITIETILTSLGSAVSVKLKLMLTIISNLTKNNSFIKKILKLGIVSHLLLVFDRWRKFNTSKKYKLCHLILCILQKIVTTSKPSRSLISCDILHRFCLSLPDDPCHYPMITKVFCILNICSGTKTLPVASIASPVTFELPITDTPDFNSDDEDGNDSDEELDEEMDPDDIGDPEDLLLDDEDDSDNEELVDKELMDNQRDRMDKENLRDLVDKDEVGHELTGNIGENDNWSINRRSGNNNVFESGDNRLCSSNNRNMVDSRNENIDSDNSNTSNTRNGIESGNDRGNNNSKNWIGTNRLDSGSSNRIGGSNNNVVDSGIGNNNNNNNNNQFSNTNNNSGNGCDNGISAFIDGRSNSGISARRKPEANSTDQYQLLMYADHFQEFNALIPNTKENRPDPYTTSKHLDPTWLSIEPDKSERTWLSIDPPDNKSDRILRSLDLGNYVSGSDITSSPRLSSPSVGKKSTTNPSIFQDIKSNTRLDKVYQILANRVHSVVPHIKIAYPDLCLIGSVGEGMHATTFVEPLNMENKKNIRNKMLGIIDRMRHPDKMLNNVVYDFDTLYYTTQNTTPVSTLSQQEIGQSLPLSNHDVTRLGVREQGNSKALCFESRFECGNLRKAIQVGTYEYDLLLMPDVNSTHHHQWFYFEISNMDAQASYTLNIVNQEKHHSQYQHGMRPLLFSVKEARCGRALWTRVGTDICYYRNSYVRNPHQRYQGKKTSRAVAKNIREFYYTLSFNIKFKHSLDVCYLAYHYPYTYSYLMTNIWKLSRSYNPRTVHFRAEPLCDTLNHNQVPVITVTASDNINNRIEDRELIVLTSRVHPGESNASWLLDGLLSYLTGDALSAAKIRCKYVTKIVPMLNVEGVVNGCHRCGLTNEDLNRKWKSPHPLLHPEIFHTKGLIEFCTRVLKKTPYFYCDFHGHSLKKNIFLYGCSSQESWLSSDKCRVENQVEFRMLSRLLEQCALSFDPKSSHYKIERSKESTARITIWREYGVVRSYTMESTYCGFDQGSFKDTHINISHLRETGASVCVALAALHDETQYMINLIRNSDKMFEDFCRSKFKYMIENNSNVTRSMYDENYAENSDDESDEEN